MSTMRYWGEKRKKASAAPEVTADAVADYLIDLDFQRPHPGVTPMKLHLLMYLAQGHHLASTGRRLFAEDMYAMDHGPVVPSQLGRFSGRRPIAGRRRRALPRMPWEVTGFLDRLWQAYRDLPAEELRTRVLSLAPWTCDGTVRIPDAELGEAFRALPAASRIAVGESVARAS